MMNFGYQQEGSEFQSRGPMTENGRLSGDVRTYYGMEKTSESDDHTECD